MTESLSQGGGIAERIAYHERAIRALKAQQQAAFLATIAGIVGQRAFSAAELWMHARVSGELRALFVEHGITSARQLGKLLQKLQGRPLGRVRLERIGADWNGAVWILRVVADTQATPCGVGDRRI